MDEPTAVMPAPEYSGYARSADLNELAKALTSAQSKFGPVEKNRENPHYHFWYADLASLIDATRPALTAQGLALVQFPEVAETKVTVTSLLLHTSGQWLSNKLSLPAGSANRLDAQTVGSAITYAKRYAYQAILGIAAEDDDDGNQASTHAQAPKAAPAPSVNQRPASGEARPRPGETLPPEAAAAEKELNEGFTQAVDKPDPSEFPTKDERKAFKTTLKTYQDKLVKEGVKDAGEKIKNFAIGLTGVQDPNNMTRAQWKAFMESLNNADFENKLREVVVGVVE